MIVYGKGFQKDGWESAGDACFYLTNLAFGHNTVHEIARGDPGVQEMARQVEWSVGWFFVWVLTLPLNLLGMAVGALCYALSESRRSARDQVAEMGLAESQEHRLQTWHDRLMKTRDRGAQKRMRVEVLAETKRAWGDGFFVDGRRCRINENQSQAMMRGLEKLSTKTPAAAEVYPRALQHAPLIIEVRDMDSFNLAKEYLDAGLDPAVLNLANAHIPGGGVEGGAGAQEESLCRRSDLYRGLLAAREGSLYPLEADHGTLLYSSGVQVFRGREAEVGGPADQPVSYAFHTPYIVDVITCASFCIAEGTWLSADQVEMLEAKVRMIYRSALAHGKDALVLGALGCGAFHNPPGQVAPIFARVLQEPEFARRFRRIGFGILFSEPLRQAFREAFTL